MSFKQNDYVRNLCLVKIYAVNCLIFLHYREKVG